MAWYQIFLIAVLGLAALFFVVGFLVSAAAGLVITKGKGKRIRPSHARMREINIKMGHVDFDEYDRTEKEAFTIRSNGADIIQWVCVRLGQDALIGLHGESLGAITVLEELGMDDKLAFVVSDSCSTSVYHSFRDIFRLARFSVFKHIESIREVDFPL